MTKPWRTVEIYVPAHHQHLLKRADALAQRNRENHKAPDSRSALVMVAVKEYLESRGLDTEPAV